MAVDVLLFTGISAYSYEVSEMGTVPSYEMAMRTSGTYRVATYLRETYDLDVEVVDYLHSWTYEELVEIVKSRVDSNTKMVGVGGIFYLSTPNIVQLFEYVKKNYDVITIAGSQGLWSIAGIPNIDYCIVGYGELGVGAVLEGNPEYEEKEIYPGAPKIKVIDCMETKKYNAFPWQNIGIEYQKRDFVRPEETLSFETSRGCRFQCAYCNFPILGVKDDHTRSAEDFERDIKRNYDTWGTTDYIVTDDTFNDYTDKITKYADVVQQLPFEVDFTGYIRADLMTQRKGDLEQLARMRFNSHLYGIESTNRDSAKAMGKGGDPKKILEGILEAKEYFIKENGFYRGEMSFIWGLPYETRETLDWTFDWIDKNWQREAMSMFDLSIPMAGPHSIIRSNILSTNLDKYNYRRAQPVEIANIDAEFQAILDDPNVDDFNKNRMIKMKPDPNNPMYHMHQVLWKNENWDVITAWLGCQQELYGHKRYWERGIPIFNQANWTSVGYKKQDLLKSFGELGTTMHPPVEERKKVIEEYKHKKLSWVS